MLKKIGFILLMVCLCMPLISSAEEPLTFSKEGCYKGQFLEPNAGVPGGAYVVDVSVFLMTKKDGQVEGQTLSQAQMDLLTPIGKTLHGKFYKMDDVEKVRIFSKKIVIFPYTLSRRNPLQKDIESTLDSTLCSGSFKDFFKTK